ncbi:MAG: hypothetical protein IT220_06145, partial [Flavobacteriaceae bacterium]|nr:hypothetical protein [Flavobacteriaceae bacterium]
IASDILNEGTIIVESQGQIVQQNDNAVISDLGIFQIYKTTGTYFPYDYIYWSSPVEGLNIQDVFSSSNGFNSYKYKFAPSLYNDTKSGIRTG